MFPLVEFPELVQHYAPFFEDVFSAAAFIEFERYISGLIVSENKTVDGINRLFVVESRNQSSLNRLLTESPFSLNTLRAISAGRNLCPHSQRPGRLSLSKSRGQHDWLGQRGRH